MNEADRGTADLAHLALEHLDALYSFAMALSRDPTVAEDLVQDACLRAMDQQHRFTPGSNLKAWLFTLLRNLWLNRLRRETHGPRFTELDDELLESIPDGVNLDPQVLYLREAERQAVREALMRLPRALREIIMLRDLEGFSYGEIAALLDCPIGTVMSRLARARRGLRAALSEPAPQPRIKTLTEGYP